MPLFGMSVVSHGERFLSPWAFPAMMDRRELL